MSRKLMAQKLRESSWPAYEWVSKSFTEYVFSVMRENNWNVGQIQRRLQGVKLAQRASETFLHRRMSRNTHEIIAGMAGERATHTKRSAREPDEPVTINEMSVVDLRAWAVALDRPPEELLALWLVEKPKESQGDD